MRFSTDSFPSSLPSWIRDWAILNRDWDAQSLSDLCIVPKGDLPTLWRLLNSEEVAPKLHAIDRRAGINHEQLQRDVTHLLSTTCASYRQAQSQLKLSPADLERQLVALAADSKKLALNVDRFRSILEDAVSMKYLTDRTSSEDPAGFSQRKRLGLRQGSYSYLYPDAPDITDILLAFSDDVSEEIFRFKKHHLNSDGGDGGPIRYQIRRVKGLMQRLFGKAENPLIAALLSAANCSPISEDRVKKFKVKKGKN